MIKEHVSSGGIVVKIKDKEPYFLMLNKAGQGWVMPKGHVEGGETPEMAATREVSEEAGLRRKGLEILTQLGKTEYSFTKDGVENHKIVHIFLIKDNSIAPPKPLKAEDFLGVDYFSKDKALELLAYGNWKEFILKAWDYLKKN